MKNPLHYQLSEYDCGPTAMLNAINYLFEREEISPVASRHLLGESVWIGKGSPINDALCRGGAVVLRVLFDCGHYVLLTGVRGDNLLMFDPYYIEEKLKEPGVIEVHNQPFRYNRIVNKDCFNRETNELYALGPVEDREAVILFNEKTKRAEEDIIEYFI